jgi:predicted DNA-binding protein (MmcQ/YjbR family)
MLSGEGYNWIKVDLDNKLFLQLVDAEDIKASIYYIKQKWIKYAYKT